MAEMTWFKFPLSTLDMVPYYSPETVGQALTALAHFKNTGELPTTLEGIALGVFEQLRRHMEESNRAYSKICEQNRQNRIKGWEKNRGKSDNDRNTAVDERSTGVNERSTAVNDPLLREERRTEEKRKEQNRKEERQSIFPPTQQDVLLYCQQEGLQVDAARFVDYYAATGWRQGNTPIRDWKACVRNWSRRELGQGPAGKAVPGAAPLSADPAKASPIALQAIQKMLAEEEALS